MDGFANFIIRHKKLIVAVFIIAAVVCVFLQNFVDINYNMADYLPPDAQSTRALDIMDEEFGTSMQNANVMVKDVSLQEAVEYKQRLAEWKGSQRCSGWMTWWISSSRWRCWTRTPWRAFIKTATRCST
jgi:predicted RND superfamily exporter protein